MALLGQGIIPASGSVATELTAVTRRGYIPMMVVQLYNSSPLWAALLSNAKTAYGGVSSISVPVQGQQFVNSQFSDYSGAFSQPQSQQGAFLAEFDLKALITPIPFIGLEGYVQLDHAVVPLIEARMNDATNSMSEAGSIALWNNYTNTQQFIGLPGAIDAGSNLSTYGNINRTNNPWWQSTVVNTSSASATRKNAMQWVATVNKYGAEMPTFGITDFGTWTALAQDYVGAEQYNMTPGGAGFDTEGTRPRSGYRALDVSGVPVYADPYAPSNTGSNGIIYFCNSNYMALHVHEYANFSFSGFESLLPNYQIGYIAIVLTLAELVVSKPKAMGRFYNITGLSF
jgi:hypothetical protein